MLILVYMKCLLGILGRKIEDIGREATDSQAEETSLRPVVGYMPRFPGHHQHPYFLSDCFAEMFTEAKSIMSQDGVQRYSGPSNPTSRRHATGSSPVSPLPTSTPRLVGDRTSHGIDGTGSGELGLEEAGGA